MTGLWDTPGVPHKGWVDLGVHDEEEPNHVCEMCKLAHVRFVHVVRHDNYPRDLRVGCVCAEKMSNEYVAQAHETHARNRLTRRATWLTRRWRVSRAGNEFLNHQGENFTIFAQHGAWNYRVQRGSTSPRFGRGGYRTSDEAKLGVFDSLWPPFRVPPRPR